MKRNTRKRCKRRTRKRHRHLMNSSRSKAAKYAKNARFDRKKSIATTQSDKKAKEAASPRQQTKLTPKESL